MLVYVYANINMPMYKYILTSHGGTPSLISALSRQRQADLRGPKLTTYWVPGQPGLHSVTMSQNLKKKSTFPLSCAYDCCWWFSSAPGLPSVWNPHVSRQPPLQMWKTEMISEMNYSIWLKSFLFRIPWWIECKRASWPHLLWQNRG